MIRKTTWSPDTCGCVFEYSWDDEVPQELRTHTLSSVVKKCEIHKEVAVDDVAFVSVLVENQVKNKVLAEFIESHPEHVDEKDDGNGGTTKELKASVKYEWSFTGTGTERELQVDFVGANLKTSEKATLLGKVSGLGKVVSLK